MCIRDRHSSSHNITFEAPPVVVVIWKWFSFIHEVTPSSITIPSSFNIRPYLQSPVLTVDQLLVWGIGNASGEGSSGSMHLYDPAGTTYVKSWISKASEKVNTEYPIQTDIQGYLNTTSAITGIRFLCDSGNVDTGTIKMYGIK